MEYICDARLVIRHPVEIKLSPAQLAARKGRVTEVGSGLYTPINEIEFKAGEKIVVPDLPKALMALVRAPGSAPAPKAVPTVEAPVRRQRR